MADFVTAFPADLRRLRPAAALLGTPEAGTLTESPYDTADLRVDGDRWELVRGGTASCADAVRARRPDPTGRSHGHFDTLKEKQMNFRMKKTWVAALGLALAVSTAGGVALAVGPRARTPTRAATPRCPTPNNIGVPLKLYDAGGTEVTSGTHVATPLAAFAAADGTVRAGDEYASLFIHLPQSSTAPGAWPGVQATGTDKFTGCGRRLGARHA